MKHLNLTIPEPCHEDWSGMSSTEKGKFCKSCTKEVFDFTTYSDEQLIKRFEKDGDLCGRFTTSQLDRDLILQRKKNHNYLSYAFSGVFSLLLLNTNSSKAQEKPNTTQTDKKFTSIPLQNTRANDSIIISGTVSDETNMPLPGGTVVIKGTKSGTSTDFDGKYSIQCKKTDTLVFSYVGYTNHETLANKIINVNLKPDKSLENVVVTSLGMVRKRNELHTKIKVTGTVLDETQYPLPGATVIIKGTTNGTTTDFDGLFSLTCKKTDTLVFSYVGYDDYKIFATDKLNIVLAPNKNLDKVIIVSGGIHRKEYSTTTTEEEVVNRLKKRWFGGNLFTRFTNLFRKNNKNPNYRF